MVLHPKFDAAHGDGRGNGTGVEDEGEEAYYSVSVFHQLHCLGVIRRGYYGGVGNEDGGGREEHVGHCFDFLRQAVQCSESFLRVGSRFGFRISLFLFPHSGRLFGERRRVKVLLELRLMRLLACLQMVIRR